MTSSITVSALHESYLGIWLFTERRKGKIALKYDFEEEILFFQHHNNRNFEAKRIICASFHNTRKQTLAPPVEYLNRTCSL